MMTTKQIRLALRLWKAYRTETAQYRALAAELGIQVTELNQRCSWLNRGQHWSGPYKEPGDR